MLLRKGPGRPAIDFAAPLSDSPWRSASLPTEEPRSRAFPNAYLSTDEPPRRSALRRIACAFAAAGFAYLGAVILVLSVITTEYSPISQAASDYAVGPYAPWIGSGFFFAASGMVGLAVTLVLSRRPTTQRAGGVLMLTSGVALLFDSFFATDVEGAPATFHGAVHGVAGVVFFLVSPLALLLVGGGFGRRWLACLSSGLLAAAAFVVADGALALDAFGLVERIAVLVIFSSTILTAARVYRES